MNRATLKFLAIPFTAAALLLAATHPAIAQDTKPDTAKQDMKDAGSDTKNAAKKTGHGIATGTKKAAGATKNGTVKAYDKTKAGTKKVVHGAAKGTAKGADKVEDKTAPK
jgi:hypothetical protein